VAITPEHFTSAGAVCQIAFQAVHPEFDLDLRAHGVVHARFSVPGEGVFEASTETRLRGYSALRDQLQLQTGRRFFAGEYTTGRP
jgi:hypothetical protein